MITSTDHFVLTVRSVAASLDFYERVLGLEREILAGRPAALKFGSQKINLHQIDRTFEPKAETPTPGSGDFCLVTEQPIAEVVAHLKREAVEIEVGPIARNGARGQMLSIYFRDPDRNLVEVSSYEERP
ncbi:MAG TPA: VOC family protein, partial [Devosiaceae bacterium]|nr:VOC family protein [Devosiaceae bacterium]